MKLPTIVIIISFIILMMFEYVAPQPSVVGWIIGTVGGVCATAVFIIDWSRKNNVR